jgi:tetratricopeptide (TPR) repeat protein
MGLFDRFRKHDSPATPDDLRKTLFDAIQREDSSEAMALINDNSDTIREQFRAWAKVPESIRKDPIAIDGYGKALILIASLFERSGDSSLKNILTGADRDNPIVQWQKDLERVDGMIEHDQAANAIPLLRAMLEAVNQLSGPGADGMRARTLGRLGHALSDTGEQSEAIRVTREALELCRAAGDEEGVQAYQRNLAVLTGHVITDPDSLRGPMRVVFMDSDGRTIPPEELPQARGNIRWEVRFDGAIHPEANRLHQEGRAAGAKGDFDRAIVLLTQASELSPDWPYPTYDRAFSHLLKQEFELARVAYRRVLELSPKGFFMAAQTLDMLEREAAGEFPAGLSIGIATLPDMPEEQRRSTAEQLVQKFPSCPAGWQTHANFIKDPTARLEAIDRGLAARPDPDTRGFLSVNKALVLADLGKVDAAIGIVKPLTDSIGDSISAHAAACTALAMIRARHHV